MYFVWQFWIDGLQMYVGHFDFSDALTIFILLLLLLLFSETTLNLRVLDNFFLLLLIT